MDFVQLFMGLMHQGIGINVMMGIDMLETAKRMKFAFIDSHLELDTNFKIRAEMKNVGGIQYKKYRIYYKMLKDNTMSS